MQAMFPLCSPDFFGFHSCIKIESLKNYFICFLSVKLGLTRLG